MRHYHAHKKEENTHTKPHYLMSTNFIVVVLNLLRLQNRIWHIIILMWFFGVNFEALLISPEKKDCGKWALQFRLHIWIFKIFRFTRKQLGKNWSIFWAVSRVFFVISIHLDNVNNPRMHENKLHWNYG